jgi:nitronate monooxygenase
VTSGCGAEGPAALSGRRVPHDVIRPVVVAPMAGGPSTPALVVGAARAGAVGFLAAGYKTPEAVERELRDVGGSGLPYGLNIFVPVPPPKDTAALERYRRLLEPEVIGFGVGGTDLQARRSTP